MLLDRVHKARTSETARCTLKQGFGVQNPVRKKKVQFSIPDCVLVFSETDKLACAFDHNLRILPQDSGRFVNGDKTTAQISPQGMARYSGYNRSPQRTVSKPSIVAGCAYFNVLSKQEEWMNEYRQHSLGFNHSALIPTSLKEDPSRCHMPLTFECT